MELAHSSTMPRGHKQQAVCTECSGDLLAPCLRNSDLEAGCGTEGVVVFSHGLMGRNAGAGSAWNGALSRPGCAQDQQPNGGFFFFFPFLLWLPGK